MPSSIRKRTPNVRSKPSFPKHPSRYALVLDVGTTGIKAFVFDEAGVMITKVYKRISKISPKPGWVEQDPKELLRVSKTLLKRVVRLSKISPKACVGFGLTNQRETTILWNKKTGTPVYPAIVWEDKRTQSACTRLRKAGEEMIQKKTGLSLLSYFSATKIQWILDHVPLAQTLLQKESLAFGTVDSWLLWHLCEGNPHVTDETNASRTLLFNIQTKKWDPALLHFFSLSPALLPQVLPSRAVFGMLKKDILGTSLPVHAVCGDQQASLFAAITTFPEKIVTKVTYGTGAFIMQTISARKNYEGFFTTLTPGSRGSLYAVEAKVEGVARRVLPVLRNSRALYRTLEKIAKEVDVSLRRLPLFPRTIVIDGGATRNGTLAEIQARVSGVCVIEQKPFDGTALGMARMLFETQKTS